MITLLRRYINTWPVRAMFLVLVAAFGTWGIADVIRQIGTTTAVATVAGQSIEMPALQEAYQRQLAQVGRMFGAGFNPTPPMRRSIAEQALDRLISQAVIRAQAQRLGLTVTEDAMRDATFAIPAFRGTDGRFSKVVFQQVLQNNGLDEGRFLALMREDLAQREIVEAVRAGAVAPDTLVQAIFTYQQEKRVATLAELPFAAVPTPPAPTDAALMRYWENNPDSFTKPEYRRVKAVILSVQTLARDIEIGDDELKTAYEQRRSQYNSPERRTAEVLVAPDRTKAEDLAQQWRSGADWTQMQSAAAAVGGSGIELTEASAAEFPDPALAQDVFAAPPDTVLPPKETPLGWRVVRVTGITPAVAQSFDDVKKDLQTQLAEQKANDELDDRVNKVEDALAGGGGLDALPGGLGLAAVTGTLDAQGITPDGLAAPIPAGPEVKSALIAASFQMKVGDPPKFTEVPAPARQGQAEGPSSWYAVVVEAVTPPALEPFDAVKDRVREAVVQAAVQRTQEIAAAGLLAAMKGGQSIDDAAVKIGARVTRSAPVSRETAPAGVPQQLVQPLFSLKLGEATMVETADGFVVAVLAEIETPDVKTDPIGYGQVRSSLERSISDDLEITYVQALRDQARPKINQEMVDSLIQP